jgi:hypothetical protein
MIESHQRSATRIPSRNALWANATPIPRPLVPMGNVRFCSRSLSSVLYRERTICARGDEHPSLVRYPLLGDGFELLRRKPRVDHHAVAQQTCFPGYEIPEGLRWSLYVTPS